MCNKYGILMIGTMTSNRILIPRALKDLKLQHRTNASVYFPGEFAIHKIYDNAEF